MTLTIGKHDSPKIKDISKYILEKQKGKKKKMRHMSKMKKHEGKD